MNWDVLLAGMGCELECARCWDVLVLRMCLLVAGMCSYLGCATSSWAPAEEGGKNRPSPLPPGKSQNNFR